MKLAIGMLLIILFLSGCGTTNTTEGENTIENRDGISSNIVAGDMIGTLTKVAPLHYKYRVKNKSKEIITLKFTSSQRIDYSVTTKNQEEIFLFSSTAAFLSALGEEEISPEEELIYDIHLTDLNLVKGEYTLSAWMTPDIGQLNKVSTDFLVK